MRSLLAYLLTKAIPQEPHLRILALSTFVNTFGNGLFMTVDVIYFTTIVGLSPAQVALAHSISGLIMHKLVTKSWGRTPALEAA